MHLSGDAQGFSITSVAKSHVETDGQVARCQKEWLESYREKRLLVSARQFIE